MKKAVKILTFVLVFALALMPMMAFAAPDSSTSSASDMISGFKNGSTTGIIGTDTQGAVNDVIAVVRWVAIAIALVMVTVLGIQWMLATPAKKAELKGKMWSMAIGIVLVVGGLSIVSWIATMGEGLAGKL